MTRKKLVGVTGLVLGFILILLLVSGIVLVFQYYTRDKFIFGVKYCLEQNNCLSRVVDIFNLKFGSFECKGIKDSLVKDLCYQRLLYEGYYEKINPGRDSNICIPIENPYLSHVCLRSIYRPHMNQFMISPYSQIQVNINMSDECSSYDNYTFIYCNYLHAASLTKHNLTKAMDICNNLNDDKITGECNFYIATSLALNIEEDTKNKIGKLNNFCGTISYPFWRAECYYLLADELALIKPSSEVPIKEVAKACTKSQLIASYACFSHVNQLIDLEKVKEICRAIENPLVEYYCYKYVGEEFLDFYNFDALQAKKECDNVPEKYKEDCIKETYRGVGLISPGRILEISKKCNELPTEFKEYCFSGLGSRIAVRCSGNVYECAEECDNLPKEFKHYCYDRIGTQIGWYSNFDLLTSFAKCNKIPTEYRENCYYGISTFVGNNAINNVNETIELCKQFPKEHQENCFVTIGQRVYRHFLYNWSNSIEKCTEMPSELQEYCFNGLAKGRQLSNA